MVELARDELPAAVLQTDEIGHRHPNVLIVRRVHVVPPERVDRAEREPLRVRGHDDDRDALVPLRLRIGAARQPHVVRVVGKARPDLLAVDNVMVAIDLGLARQRRQIRPCPGLAIPNREVTLALENAGQVLRLLLVRPELLQRGSDGVQRQNRNGETRPLHLVEEDELLDRAAVLAAVLLRPADTQPAIGTHLLDGPMIERPATLGGDQLVLELRRHELAHVRADLFPERFLFGGVVEIHTGVSPGWI